jgi:hypothetical protein
MSGKPLPPGLQVILGDSAAGIFRRVFSPAPDQLDIDRDVLSCGPTPASESLDAWAAVRTNYWNSIPREPGEAHYPLMDVARRAQTLSAAPRINLWAGTGLSEQLSAAFTIHLAEAGVPSPGKFWIVQFDQVPGAPAEIYGLGLLNEQAMEQHPQPHELTHVELQNYRDLWAAATSPAPQLMERFSATHPDASPWLRRAALLLLRRFPDLRSGLNYWDQALLAECSTENRKAARIVGDAIARHSKECDPMGDFALFGRLMSLGRAELPQRLIEIAGSGSHMRQTEVRLTPFGQDVRDGRASNYPANPIEDWAAGVKLSSREGNLWFNDGGKLARP